MANDPIGNLLKTCCGRIDIPLKGTGFLIAPKLAITAFHVLESYAEGQTIDIYITGNRINATILYTDRNYDFAILELDKSFDTSYVILDDNLVLNDELFGYGFPVIDEKRYESGFLGSYSSFANFKNKFNLDQDFYAIQGTQVSPGHSGSPVINLRTGKCIGMTTRTVSRNSPYGGHIIPAGKIIEKLNGNQLYDVSRLQEKRWEIALSTRNAQKAGIERAETKSRLLSYAGAYNCNRVEIVGDFKMHYSRELRQLPFFIANYIVTGEEECSPLGLARQLLAEARAAIKPANLRYPGDPDNRNDGALIKVNSNTQDFELIDMLFDVVKGGKEDEIVAGEDGISRLFEALKKWQCVMIPVLITLDGNKNNNRQILKVVARFVKEIQDIETSNRHSSKIIFFWCIQSVNRLFSVNDIAIINEFKKCLNVEDKSNLFSKLFRFGNRRQAEGIKPLSQGIRIWPVTESKKLQKLTPSHIKSWIIDFNNCNPEITLVNEEDKSAICNLPSTVSVESQFIRIIDAFNHKKPYEFEI